MRAPTGVSDPWQSRRPAVHSQRDTGFSPPIESAPAVAGAAAAAGADLASWNSGRLHAVRRARRSLPRVLSGLGCAAAGSERACCACLTQWPHTPSRWSPGRAWHTASSVVRVLHGRHHDLRRDIRRGARRTRTVSSGSAGRFAHLPSRNPALTVIARSSTPGLKPDSLAAHRFGAVRAC